MNRLENTWNSLSAGWNTLVWFEKQVRQEGVPSWYQHHVRASSLGIHSEWWNAIIYSLSDGFPYFFAFTGLLLFVTECDTHTHAHTHTSKKHHRLAVANTMFILHAHWSLSLAFILTPQLRRLQTQFDACKKHLGSILVYLVKWISWNFSLCQQKHIFDPNHESELWKSKAGVLVYKDRGGLKIDLATGQNWYIKGKGPSPLPPRKDW